MREASPLAESPLFIANTSERMDLVFFGANPPDPTKPPLGARLSNTTMLEMMGGSTLSIDSHLASSTEGQPTIANLGSLAAYLHRNRPRAILFETPGEDELRIFTYAVPRDLRANTAAIWRYTLLPKQPEGETDIAAWGRLLEVRGTMARNVGLNICISPHQRDELLALGVPEDNIVVIPNQVGWDITTAKREQGAGHRAEYLADDELGVLISSRIHPEKGLDWLPPFVAKLRAGRKAIHLDSPYRKIRITLAGPVDDPALWERLQSKLAQSDVDDSGVIFEWAGTQNSTQMKDRMAAYDILLAPSPEEGFGRVTVEAMRAGMTVVGNANCPATAGILNQPPYTVGQLASNPETAADQVLGLASNPTKLTLLQRNAAQWTKGHYTEERARAALQNTIARTVAGNLALSTGASGLQSSR